MRNILRAAASILLLTLVGCVTSEDIRAGVSTLKGQPYKVAFDRLGFPDREDKIAGYTVYSWLNQNAGSYTVPTYQTATSYVNGQPIYTSIQGTQTESYNYYCKLDVIVDASGIVSDTKIDGNLGGCERYAKLAPKKKV
jgi:hypothetical protein